MRVTVCQLPNEPDRLERAWSDLVAHVAVEASDLVLLPEMPFHPWLAASRAVDPAAWEAAERDHARWIDRLGELDPATVVVTRPVTVDGRRLNRALVRRPDETPRTAHDKFYLPDEEGFWEATWYERGAGDFEPVRVGGTSTPFAVTPTEAVPNELGAQEPVEAGILICTEMWFLERARAYGRDGVELLCVPRATPWETLDKWLAGGRAAAVVAGAYCLSSNPWRPQGESPDLCGGGWVIDPDGEVLAITDEARPFATVAVDPQRARDAKSTYPRYVQE